MAVRTASNHAQPLTVPSPITGPIRIGRPLLTLVAAISFALAILMSGVLVYGYAYRDAVYPGVSAAGVSLSGVTPNEAEILLNSRAEGYLGREIVFLHDGMQFSTTLGAVGAQLDTRATAAEAYQVGRTGNWWNDSLIWLSAFISGREVPVHSSVDGAQLETFLRTIASEVTVPAENPTFVATSTGGIELTDGSPGLAIDVASTLRELRHEVAQLGEGPIRISTVAVPPAYERNELEPAYGQLDERLSRPLILELNGFEWVLEGEQLRSVLRLSSTSGGEVPEIRVRDDRLQRHLESIAGESVTGARDASVFWNGSEFEVRESIDGQQIDVERSVPIVAEAILAADERVALVASSTPASLTTEIAQEAADFGNALLEQRIELTWDGGSTTIGGSVVAAALTFSTSDDGSGFVPQIDTSQLALFLTSINNQVEVKPVNADLRYFDGEVVLERREESGLKMDREASAESIAQAVIAGERSARLSVEIDEPDVTAAMASDVVIRELISFGETYYGGSAANRRHNVEHSTRLANGALVPPGGVYSFVETIGGEISLETGYQLGFGIEGATDGSVTTVPSVGGGVCQVSTTIFQAAFWAGMPMVERNWHSYWMPLYGQPPSGITGLDATVDTSAGLDFKFTNATNDWIAIVATADGNAVRFEIWGTDPGWNVVAGDPQVSNRVSADHEMQYEETDRLPAGTRTHVETAHDGFDVLIERQVFDSNGELIDDLELFSRYRPASNRTLIGTGS